MNSKLLAYRPPRIAMLLTALAIGAHLVTPLGNTHVFQSSVFGALFGLAGFAVMMQAWWQFRQERVAICPTSDTDHLITTGIYAFSRNPMYLGLTMMLLGAAVWQGTLPFYATASAYLLIINNAFCPYEEDKLTAAFGDQFKQYRSTVRRWL